MKPIASLFLLILALSPVFGQNYYRNIDYSNFRNQTIFSEKIDIDKFNPDVLNACIFHATNEIRVKRKLAPLAFNSLLEQAATIHSKDMVNKDFFSHTNPFNKNHKEPDDRARVAGVTNPHIAENIIEGFILKYRSGQEVVPKAPGVFALPGGGPVIESNTYLSLTDNIMQQWISSKGHKANILAKDALQLGVGTAFYSMTNFNNMPAVKATQCFQWFENVAK